MELEVGKCEWKFKKETKKRREKELQFIAQ